MDLDLLIHKHLLVTSFTRDCLPGTGDTKINDKVLSLKELTTINSSYNS